MQLKLAEIKQHAKDYVEIEARTNVPSAVAELGVVVLLLVARNFAFMTKFTQKFTLLLIISLFFSCFAAAQTARNRKKKNSSVKSAATQTAAIEDVDFCDLTINPKLHAGKLVRVKGSIFSWWESSYLYNVKCETKDQKIHDGLDCSGKKECASLGKKVYGVINKNQLADKNEYAFRAYVTLIGRLSEPNEIGFGHLNSFKFEFRIKKVESSIANASRYSLC